MTDIERIIALCVVMFVFGFVMGMWAWSAFVSYERNLK